jgi:hypothetical protein
VDEFYRIAFEGRPQQLARLMALAVDKPEPWSPEELRAALQSQLGASVSVFPSEPGTEIETRPPIRLGDVLRGGQATLESLRSIKTFAKLNVDHPESGVPYEVCKVLYYASIAAALKQYSRRISRLTNAEMQQGFNWALAQPWLDYDVRQLLQEASSALHE